MLILIPVPCDPNAILTPATFHLANSCLYFTTQLGSHLQEAPHSHPGGLDTTPPWIPHNDRIVWCIGARVTWLQILSLLFINRVTMGKLLSLSVPSFSHL